MLGAFTLVLGYRNTSSVPSYDLFKTRRAFTLVLGYRNTSSVPSYDLFKTRKGIKSVLKYWNSSSVPSYDLFKTGRTDYIYDKVLEYISSVPSFYYRKITSVLLESVLEYRNTSSVPSFYYRLHMICSKPEEHLLCVRV